MLHESDLQPVKSQLQIKLDITKSNLLTNGKWNHPIQEGACFQQGSIAKYEGKSD